KVPILSNTGNRLSRAPRERTCGDSDQPRAPEPSRKKRCLAVSKALNGLSPQGPISTEGETRGYLSIREGSRFRSPPETAGLGLLRDGQAGGPSISVLVPGGRPDVRSAAVFERSPPRQ